MIFLDLYQEKWLKRHEKRKTLAKNCVYVIFYS